MPSLTNVQGKFVLSVKRTNPVHGEQSKSNSSSEHEQRMNKGDEILGKKRQAEMYFFSFLFYCFTPLLLLCPLFYLLIPWPCIRFLLLISFDAFLFDRFVLFSLQHDRGSFVSSSITVPLKALYVCTHFCHSIL